MLAWSIALATNGDPIMVLKVPADIDQSYGLRMVIGPYTTVLSPRRNDCSKTECRILTPFETTLRTLIVTQQKIGFSVMRGGAKLNVDAPLAGMSEALDMARRDPIGLLAAQRQPKSPPKRKVSAKPVPAKRLATAAEGTAAR